MIPLEWFTEEGILTAHSNTAIDDGVALDYSIEEVDHGMWSAFFEGNTVHTGTLQECVEACDKYDVADRSGGGIDMTSVTLPCPHCRGCGRVVLTGEYLVTLTRLRTLGGEWTGAALARDMDVKPTAMNNRLARLEEHGLVTSRRWGRERRFKAKGVRS